MDVAAGTRLGSYEILGPLGAGGMGEVWRARHLLLGRPAAVKIVRPASLGAATESHARTLLRRFEREARATSLLRSPHTVQVFDFGTTSEGSFYYVMELLDGLDLSHLVEQHGPLPAERVVFVLQQICESLAEAHGSELIRGSSSVDGRTDLYSLGCVAYWLLTGQLVFGELNAMQVIAAHLSQTPEPPSERSEMVVPPALEGLVLSCLEKDPARRPASAEAVARQLADCPLQESWSETRAAQWWQFHYPSGVAPPAPSSETDLPPVAPSAQSVATSAEPTPIAEESSGPSGLDTRTGVNQWPFRRAAMDAEPDFALPRRTSRALFLIIQLGYVAMYSAALIEAEALQQALYRAFLIPAGPAAPLVIALAMCSLAERFYLISAVGFNHPAAGIKFRRLFPVILLLDAVWAAAPLLLVGKLGLGLPLVGVAGLAYLPFSQRTLMHSIYPRDKDTHSELPRP